MAGPLRVQICGPLKRYVDGFGAELARQGYTRISARYQLQLMAHVSRWLADKGLDSTGLTPATIEAFVTVRRAAGYTNHRSPKAVAPLLEYLGGLGVLPLPPLAVPATPVDAVLERYRHYLTVERGLVTSTARGYADIVRPFLAKRATADGVDLEHLTAGDVSAFVLAECPRRSRGLGQADGHSTTVPARLPARGRRARGVASGSRAIGRWVAAERPATSAGARPSTAPIGQLRPSHHGRTPRFRGPHGAGTTRTACR